MSHSITRPIASLTRSYKAILVCTLSALFLSCTKDSIDEPEAPLHGELQLGVVFKHGAHPYELGTIYTDAAEHEFRLDTLRILISAPHGVDDHGTVVANFPSACLLVDASVANLFLLGELHSYHLHELRFTAGLVPALNHADPGTTDALQSVAPMHSGNTSEGHFFLMLAGQVDGNGDGILDASDPTFSYKCMGSDLLRTGMAPAHADAPEHGPMTVNAVVDMAVLLANIDFLATPSATGNQPIHVQLMDQLAEAMEQGH